jgi:integrase
MGAATTCSNRGYSSAVQRRERCSTAGVGARVFHECPGPATELHQHRRHLSTIAPPCRNPSSLSRARTDAPFLQTHLRGELPYTLASRVTQCPRVPGSDALVRTTGLRPAPDDAQRGARVSEIASLRQRHVVFGPTTYVQLHGKGRKERSIPLWPRTAQILKEWFREIDAREDAMALPNVRGAALTRFAIHVLLRKAVQVASTRCPSLKSKRVSPHVIRHGTAMALLQVGVPGIAVILSTSGRRVTRPIFTSCVRP